MAAPSTTNAAAVDQSSTSGKGSHGPTRNPMRLSVAHSLGRYGDVGVWSSVMKSSRLRNPSGRASRSGRMIRNSSTTPPAAPIAITERRSRVRRAGKTFTRIRVMLLPTTAGSANRGTTTAAAKRPNPHPPS